MASGKNKKEREKEHSYTDQRPAHGGGFAGRGRGEAPACWELTRS